VDPGMGSSIHYAGSLPVSGQERPFSTTEEGRLHGTRSVWVGDASSFNYLPAKGISLTIMANAHRVARNLLAAQSYI
jgi:choline dehydrogenase-like flavoprotein